MRQIFIVFIALVLLSVNELKAQGFIFGLKGGLTMGFQKWQNHQRDPLFTYHGATFIESLPADGKFSLFAQVGYHNRGSAIRVRSGVYQDVNGMIRDYPGRTTRFEFRNIGLTIGGKQRIDWGETAKLYYLFGIRGEYTIGTNLDDFSQLNAYYNTLYYPDETFVKRFVGGLTAGGGVELPFSEYVNGFIEITFNPDFTNQYNQFPFSGYDPRTGNDRLFNETLIKNNSIEVSIGFGFLRKIEYVDYDVFW